MLLPQWREVGVCNKCRSGVTPCYAKACRENMFRAAETDVRRVVFPDASMLLPYEPEGPKGKVAPQQVIKVSQAAS